MKLYSKGFTVIELTMTLIIMSIIAWILSEILSVPLMTVMYNRDSAEICYLADLSMERIESSLRTAQIDTVRILNDNEIQFKNNDNQEIIYRCQNQQIRQIINSQSDLMAPNKACRFEVEQENGYHRIKIWLTFLHNRETPVVFYREVNLRDKA